MEANDTIRASLDSMGPWEGGLPIREIGCTSEAAPDYLLPVSPTPPTEWTLGVVPAPKTIFPTHRNDFSPGDVGCDVAHEERASLVQGSGFTFQPRGILRLLPFFFLGLLLFLDCIFYAESSGSW